MRFRITSRIVVVAMGLVLVRTASANECVYLPDELTGRLLIFDTDTGAVDSIAAALHPSDVAVVGTTAYLADRRELGGIPPFCAPPAPNLVNIYDLDISPAVGPSEACARYAADPHVEWCQPHLRHDRFGSSG